LTEKCNPWQNGIPGGNGSPDETTIGQQMAWNKSTAEKLAWQPITADTQGIPDAVMEAAASLEAAREHFEDTVKNKHPAPKGRKWRFSYKYGQAIALADGPAPTVNYFAKS
jgi:hypothetical protein